jgi:hypothetical protein
MARSTALTQLTIVRRSLRALDRALADFAASLRAYRPEAPVPAKTVTRRRARTSLKARAAWKLQGAYMGHMRQLKPAQKAMVRAVKAKRGTKAAIRKAQELAGKPRAA